MRTFTIGKTRSRAMIASICVLTCLAALTAVTGQWTLLGNDAAALAALPPEARCVLSVLLALLLGMLVLSVVITSARYWQLTEDEIRCRSLGVTSDWPRYAWDVLRGRNPEVDIRIATAAVTGVRLSWSRQIVTTPWTRGIPTPMYPITVEMTLAGGGSVDFYHLDYDVVTLGRALRYLIDERGVALEDPDHLLSQMGKDALCAERIYTYLEGLDREGRKRDGDRAEGR